MIKVGSTYVLLQDPGGAIDQHIEKYHSLELMRVFAKAAAVSVPRGSNLLFPNYPVLPAPRLNQLVIPTGATRWSYCLFLVTTDQKDTILEESADNSNRVKVTFESESNWKQPTSDNWAPEFSLTMSPLSPRPITPANLAETDDIRNLWVLPMVDQRYWWQFLNVELIESEAFSSIPDVVDYLNGKLNGTATLRLTCPKSTHQVPDISAGNNYENVAVVIETLAWHIGCQLVPEINSKSVRASDQDTGFAFISVDDSPLIYENNLSGKVGIAECIRGSGDPSSSNSGWENVGVPSIEMGGPFGESQGSAFLPEKVLIPSKDSFVSRTVSQLGLNLAPYNLRAISGTSSVFRMKWKDVETVSDELRDQACSDFYRRFLKTYDYTFSGVQKWQPTAFDDAVIVSQARFSEGFRVQTRVRSWAQNLIPESLVVASSSGSSGGGGSCDCSCLDSGDIVLHGVEVASRYTWRMNSEEFRQANGTVAFAGGSVTVEFNAGLEKWTLDVSDKLSAKYLDGTDATAVTVLTGELTMQWDGPGTEAVVQLCVSGEIPALVG
jgi:hypothetical protein